MDKDYIYNNIDIAQYYLSEFHLLAEGDPLILDLCFLPPFKWKAYYMQIVGKNGAYKAHCAYTRYADIHGLSCSQSFETVEKVDVLSHKKGDVICKIVDIDPKIVKTVTEQILSFEPAVVKNDGITIDGFFAAARLFQGGEMSKEIILTPKSDDSSLIKTMISVSEII